MISQEAMVNIGNGVELWLHSMGEGSPAQTITISWTAMLKMCFVQSRWLWMMRENNAPHSMHPGKERRVYAIRWTIPCATG